MGIALARGLTVALLAALLLAPASLPAADIPLDGNGLPLWVPRVWNDFPVRIELADRAALAALLSRVPVASFDREQVAPAPTGTQSGRIVWQPRVTDAEAAALAAAGYALTRLPDVERRTRQDAEAAWAAQAAQGGTALKAGEKGIYHTQAQILAILQQEQTDHPAIARYYSLGNSVGGRPLNAVEITANVGTPAARPQVRLAANIHGNEVVQLENLLTLAEYLTNNYGTDPVVTELVDNTDIHIVPSLNPDGQVAGARENANAKDLNRNFPVPDGSMGDDLTWTEQPETILIKNHGAVHHFVLSEVGHGGALVVNYLWDYTYALAPDDAGVQQAALEYSQFNAPMYASSSFTHGITNGAAWYVVHGSLQDWSYQETGCWDFTIEVGTSMAPPASQLDAYWNDNRESLLHFIKAARYGVRGVVTASGTGEPLAATVTVTGISKPAVVDPAFGDYYKPLPTGTYELTFAAPGCTPRTISGVSTTWGTGTVLNVALDPVTLGGVSGLVRNPGHRGLNATVAVTAYPAGTAVATTTADSLAGGAYALNLPYGEYTFTVARAGYAPVGRRVTIAAPSRTESFELQPVTEVVLVSETFESGAGGWSGGTWGLTTTQSHSATRSLADSPAGNYANNATNTVTRASLDLTGALAGTLTFWARWALEATYDGVFFEISTDGGVTWTALPTAYTAPATGSGAQTPIGTPLFQGSQTTWVQNTVDLAPYLTKSDVRFRFRLRSDSSTVGDGMFVDDFTVRLQRPSLTGSGDPPSPVARLGVAPNPFNPRTTISFDLARAQRVDLAIYDTGGRRVATLIAGELAAGPHAVVWAGRGADGKPEGSSLYYCRLAVDGQVLVRKLTLIK